MARWEERLPDRLLLHRACRAEAQAEVGARAALLPLGYDWEDLVLPARQKTALRGICNRLRDGGQVYEAWGFDAKTNGARGVSALFYGPPGTGKTMAAQVVAKALGLDLYRVDLSAVLSKYIGETQKNLGSVFAEVEKSQGILFFDEADALFGRRTEVKDSHDRYANADTAFLLQKIESYAGIAILATNYYQNFDEAFKRRLQFVLEFPLPDAAQRLELWQKAFPAAAPLASDADLPWLAERFELSGSNIRNIALAAAFSAAAAGSEITLAQLLEALREELQKFGRALHTGELGKYAWLLEEVEERNGGLSPRERI